MTAVRVSNARVRRALLWINGLSPGPEPDVLPLPGPRVGSDWTRRMVARLGFVQVDPISAVERAQHHILFTRNPHYRQPDLDRALEIDRVLFENWTHDAAILPVEYFPYWRHYMRRFRRFEIHAGYRRYFAPVTDAGAKRVLARLRREGPLLPRDLGDERANHVDPSFPAPTLAKITLEWLWRTGRVAVCRREGRQKVYDLTERVIPARYHEERVGRDAYVDWACRESLTRLGAGSPAQIARLFDAVSKEQAAAWCRRRLGREVVELRVDGADGSAGGPSYAVERSVAMWSSLPAPDSELRLLNPFDPLIHDRKRTLRLFGFDYSVEIWVPPNKRRYGYYVMPILEGERFTGRVDAKTDREAGLLRVLGLWWEPGVHPTRKRMAALEGELTALARFAGAGRVEFARGIR
ncbi:MAG TPA: crosslink repair DNA glycosylase YcaQ family protein [Candidatus Polarisedimenticolaceae bacterium]|nr:crosslink repair DNA glycosylase YcaQ family protein [Candidatus Polarisedimenticolaceae bacterium]